MIFDSNDHATTLQVGDLTATIGDNDSNPPGATWRYDSLYDNETQLTRHPGYNGLWHLSSIHQPMNLFMDKVAGLNYEFIFDGELQDDMRPYSYDPRRCACWLEPGEDQRSVRIHQPPTEHHGLESWWEFQLVPPHYVDLIFACVPTRPFPRGWFTVFWANYIANPTDPSMLLVAPGGRLLPRPVTPGLPTVVPARSRALPTRDGWKEGWLKRDRWTIAAPYFVGVQRGMMFQVMVRTDGLLGFASLPAPTTFFGLEHIPWDFHVTFFDARPGDRYTFEARVVYAPWKGDSQAHVEYQRWAAETTSVR